ncbi:carbohydrate ABC transporter permease [Cohnella caldifontis]|uniref:carbohydrate ABC transporter permease n=1 Tax=Cohnella caldifontis TaxID=3027471 RepID=UPI0023EE17FB|nr:sugar ABC transporter permease [Cohnella sp. YIM B05605]
MRSKGVSYSKYGYIFCLPFILAFLVFSLYPTVYTAAIGFTDMKGVIPKSIHILDNPFQNFKDLIFDNPSFKTSLSNTFLLWIWNFIPQIVLALLLTAWFTNRRLKIRGQGAFKILLYMPNIITASSIAVLFSSLFAYPMGPINSLFEMMGWQPFDFLQDKTTTRGIVAFIQFWMWYGNTMIVLIAGVMGISPDLFESAQIDGANGTQTFFRITLPNLRTIMLFTLITSMIGGLQMFDIPQLITRNGGGPDNATLTTSVFIYQQAFRGSYMYNRAAAASMIMFVIAAVLSAIVFYLMRDRYAAKLKKQEKKIKKAARAAARGA